MSYMGKCVSSKNVLNLESNRAFLTVISPS